MYVCVIKVLLRLRGTEPTNHEVANASSKTRLLNNEAEWNGKGDGMTEGENEEVCGACQPLAGPTQLAASPPKKPLAKFKFTTFAPGQNWGNVLSR